MSRAGRTPIEVPNGVQVKIEKDKVLVSGPKGKLEQVIDSPFIKIEMEKNIIFVKRNKETSEIKAKHGLYRSLIFNMVKGVSDGFEKNLNMVGVGYRAQKQGNKLVLQLGYSHPIEIDAPEGIDFIVEGTNKIKVTGANRQLVGQIAQNIKYCRPVEPYKGKGVHYQGQYIRRKAGKAAKGAA